MGKLQFFLNGSAVLVPGHERCFQVDPEDTIVPLLRDSDSVPQLLAAWEIVQSRVELGLQFMEKYEKEFHQESEGLLFSPTSTSVDVTEGLKTLETSDQKLRHLVAYYPHHNQGMTHDQRLHIMSDSWDGIFKRAEDDAELEQQARNPNLSTAAEGSLLLPDSRDASHVTVRGGRRSEEASLSNTIFNSRPTPPLLNLIQPLVHLSPLKPPQVLSEFNTSGLFGPDTTFNR